MPRELEELLTASDRAWLKRIDDAMRVPNQRDELLSALAAAYERLQEECAGAHRAARRNRGAFVKATAIAAAMVGAAIAGWVTAWLRG